MIICKRPAPPNARGNNNNNRGDGGLTRVTGVTRGDGREGGEEGKGEEGKGDGGEIGDEGGEEILAGGRTDGWTNRR